MDMGHWALDMALATAQLLSPDTAYRENNAMGLVQPSRGAARLDDRSSSLGSSETLRAAFAVLRYCRIALVLCTEYLKQTYIVLFVALIKNKACT
eukprot:6180524-Pleurochrysis_carterae.AAC.4